jgi:imidazolonepropionase-like amidohydrolase
MKNLLAALYTVAVMLVLLAAPASAQLQPLAEDDPAAVLLAGLVQPILDRADAADYLQRHADPSTDPEALHAGLSEVVATIHAQPEAVVAGLYRHPPTDEVVTMLTSESGLRLYVAIQATEAQRISSVRLPAGGWQQPPPPPLVEAAIPGLLHLPETVATVAFINVAVVPMDAERVLRDQTVVVRDGRIAQIGPSATVTPPAGALVIDGAGRYLMPGLSEMHAHIPSPQQGEGALERTLFLFLANGVTTIRGMLGHPAHLELRAQAERHEILAPRVYTSSPSINGNSAPTPEAGSRLVEEHHAAGYDFLKIHPGLSRETYDAVVATAGRVGIEWAGHVPAEVGLYRALEAGQITIDHLDAYVEALAGHGGGFSAQESGWFGLGFTDQIDVSRITALVVATREAGVWNVPTQSLMEHLLSPDDPEDMVRWPEMRYMPAQTLGQWAQSKRNVLQQAGTPERAARYLDVRRQLIAALHREGAGLLLGADAPQIFNVPGFSVHRELQFMVDSGLTPYEALATGTRQPAVFFGTDEWGTVTEGKAADLILLEANPLEDVSNAARPAGVMVRGHWLPDAEIQRRLAVIEAALHH